MYCSRLNATGCEYIFSNVFSPDSVASDQRRRFARTHRFVRIRARLWVDKYFLTQRETEVSVLALVAARLVAIGGSRRSHGGSDVMFDWKTQMRATAMFRHGETDVIVWIIILSNRHYRARI